MASSIDRVMEDISTLSADERLRLVNRIVETLLPIPPVSKEENAYKSLRGKYKSNLRPSDAFSQNKAVEQKLEDRSI